MSVFVLQGDTRPMKRRINYAKELNQEQLDVVLNGDGPCLVLAGAGSGKTRTITYRVSYLLESGVDPSRILLLTFTNKAAKSMMTRVTSLLGSGADGVWGGTFHSIGNRMLRNYADVLGYTSRFSILDQDDSQSLIKAVMKELRIDPKARRFPTASVVQNILSYTQNTMGSVQDTLQMKYPNFEDFVADIEDIGRIYHERKRAANAMDFDDLLRNWLLLMSNAEIGQRISQQFEYVLVDEYQDTNALQAAIVSAVAAVHKNVLVVGDDAQSIYAFRGANVQNILNFPKEWHGSRIFKLLTNYRSVPEVLDLANESLTHNVNQFQKDLIAMHERGKKKPVLVTAASARQEAQFVAEQILALRAEGTALANMAVLFRSSAHSQALEFELMKRDIPYEYRGGMKFFERAHIKDALAYVRICENPRDEAAWLRALNLHQGIGATTAVNLARRLQVMDVEAAVESTALPLPGKARAGWEEFAEILRRVLRERPLPGLMIKSVLTAGYRDYLEREYPDWKDRFEDLEQLALFAEGYRDCATFLADIALYDEAISGGRGEKQNASSEERMILSTIHQAKGLEWDTVFVIHLAENSFPSRRAMSEASGLEEERRLFYVAVTRARTSLFLTFPMMSGFDTMMLNQPSMFIEEVPASLFERMELREARSMRPTGQGNWSQPSAGKSRGNSDGFFNEPDRSDWSWDEPTIEVSRDGDRKSSSTASVWKSSKKAVEPPKISFLRDVDEL